MRVREGRELSTKFRASQPDFHSAFDKIIGTRIDPIFA